MDRKIFSSTHLRGKIVAIVTIGIDLAKKDLAVHGVDATGNLVLLRPCGPRTKLTELMNQGRYGHHGGCTAMPNRFLGASIASFQLS
jgi:hypothetical protein